MIGYEHNVILIFDLFAAIANPKAKDSAPVIAFHFPGVGLVIGITFLIISSETSVFSA